MMAVKLTEITYWLITAYCWFQKFTFGPGLFCFWTQKGFKSLWENFLSSDFQIP